MRDGAAGHVCISHGTLHPLFCKRLHFSPRLRQRERLAQGFVSPPAGFKPPSALPPNLIVTSQSGIWGETHGSKVSNL